MAGIAEGWKAWGGAIVLAVLSLPAAPRPGMAARLTPAEKLTLVRADVAPASARGVSIVTLPGVPRAGLPALRMALVDGASQPSPLALMASWDRDLARRVGQARARAIRAGGRALAALGGIGPLPAGRTRDGEDPLLSGRMMGEVAAGLIAGHVLPLFGGLGQPGPDGMEQDRLLALHVALEHAAGAGMLCHVATVAMRPCGALEGMERTLRDGWRYGGMIALMADRATPEAPPAMHRTLLLSALAAGVDVEGEPGTAETALFGATLRQALKGGAVPPVRLDRMAAHIMQAMDAAGVTEHPPPFGALRAPAPYQGPLVGDEVAEGTVLLRNENAVLPLAGTAAAPILVLGAGPARTAARAMADALGRAGHAARLAADAPNGTALPPDVAQAGPVVIFSAGSEDDRLIGAVADSGAHVVVVLLSDDPDRPMPWLDQVDGVVQAWSWRDGGEDALAALLGGQRDFSGRLPVTLTGGAAPAHPAGYKAFDRAHVAPLFPFGYGLAIHARFAYGDLKVTRDGSRLLVAFSVTNRGTAPGRDVPQIYLDLPDGSGEAPKRLIGWRTVQLAPGQSARLAVGIDARMLGRWNPAALEWVAPAGDYGVSLGGHSANLARQVMIHLPELHVPAALPEGEAG
ncbi:glycoside hydrolase family 3 C-terminal domain-containing protein [Gluconacetobacter sacchari]|uniref:glycoside hydrolase family 3 C-terminal domain-containing protein n=1 Tax=Gluconacetobacter sacchari TaxID=92759 RepID=UPI0039B417A4